MLAVAAFIRLAEAGADAQKAPNPILPSINEVLWGSGAFVVLFIVMAKFAYPAVVKAMHDRTDRIRRNLDDAERVRGEAQTILEEYQRQLNDARSEANRVIEEARQMAEQVRADLVRRAEAEVAELRQRNVEEVRAAKDRALAELRGQIAELAIGAAERVVERNLDRDANTQLVENFISEVGARA
jgi:F-type H+-transporting ATPase subunit b